MSALHLVASAGFVALMTTAAVEDCRRLIIPNWLVLGLLLLWPIHLAGMPINLLTGIEAGGGAFAVFLAGAVLYGRGLVGGGDVKLLAVAALWTGGDRLPTLLLLTGLCGGVLSLLLLTPLGANIGDRRQRASEPPQPATFATKSVPVPYGAAIAAAALFVTLPSPWG